MRVALSLDDFSGVNCRFEVLFALKDYFKDFKVSLFTVPIDEKKDWGSSVIREDNLEIIRNNLDWMQIIPHGLIHDGSEMKNIDYYTFREKILPRIRSMFERDKLPYVKGFKAPHWHWTEGIIRALDEEGWWGAIPRDKVIPCPKIYYQYNYSLDEPFWDSQEDLKLHGHIYGTKNDVGKCFNNLLKLPKDTEWHFVTDFLSK
jgi:hypothetical protein